MAVVLSLTCHIRLQTSGSPHPVPLKGWTFAEAPSDCFLDMLVLGGSTEGAFGLFVLFIQEMDSVAPFSSLRTLRSVAKAA